MITYSVASDFEFMTTTIQALRAAQPMAHNFNITSVIIVTNNSEW